MTATRRDPYGRDAAYYVRLGGFVTEQSKRYPGGAMRLSRAIQLCGTWRMHFAWHLAAALGWSPPSE